MGGTCRWRPEACQGGEEAWGQRGVWQKGAIVAACVSWGLARQVRYFMGRDVVARRAVDVLPLTARVHQHEPGCVVGPRGTHMCHSPPEHMACPERSG